MKEKTEKIKDKNIKRRKQLQIGDRQYIEIALKKGLSVKEIAKDLNRHRSTIYKEIKRGSFEYIDPATWSRKERYGYDVSQRKISENSHNKGRKIKLSSDHPYLSEIAKCCMKENLSLEAAIFRIGKGPVCLRTLYHYVHSGVMPRMNKSDLIYPQKKQKKKTVKPVKILSRGTPIDLRPQYINDRLEFGHWEMDTVYSSKDDHACALTMVERVGRQQLWFWMPDRSSGSVIRVLDRLERKMGTPAFRNLFKSITCDNGMEFSDWQSMERSCRTKGSRTKIYKCHPYCSSERGSNENGNRFLRRIVPKGDDFGLYSPQEIKQFQRWANSYPRRMFGGLSSDEYMGFTIDL